jgi:hypothetical protein
MPGLYFVLAVTFGAAPWALRRVSWRPAVAVTLIAAAALVGGGALGLRLYPWSDLPVAVGAVGGGLLLGRAVPAKRAPLAVLLVVAAALDTSQLLFASGSGAGTGGTTSEPAWWWWTMFVVDGPWQRSAIGMFDLLLIGTLAEHARQRSLGLVAALAPGLIGVALADLASGLTSGMGLPLIPFLFAGWLITEGWLEAVHALASTTSRTTS